MTWYRVWGDLSKPGFWHKSLSTRFNYISEPWSPAIVITYTSRRLTYPIPDAGPDHVESSQVSSGLTDTNRPSKTLPFRNTKTAWHPFSYVRRDGKGLWHNFQCQPGLEPLSFIRTSANDRPWLNTRPKLCLTWKKSPNDIGDLLRRSCQRTVPFCSLKLNVTKPKTVGLAPKLNVTKPRANSVLMALTSCRWSWHTVLQG